MFDGLTKMLADLYIIGLFDWFVYWLSIICGRWLFTMVGTEPVSLSRLLLLPVNPLKFMDIADCISTTKQIILKEVHL